MAKCLACGKSLSPTRAAICATCPCLYHKECVGIQSTSTVSEGWVCPECTKNKQRGDNTSTPVKAIGLSPPREVKAVQSSQQPAMGTSTTTYGPFYGGDQDISDMRRELAEYMTELREFRKQFRASLECIADRMDRFERRLDTLEQREVTLEAKEVHELRHKVALLESDLHERDQDLLLNDLDVGHLPEEKGENLIHSLTLVAVKLGVPLEDRDIVFAERVGAPGSAGARPRRVVVRLARRQLRDDVLRAARVRRTPTVADSTRIYINERLTRHNRHLFHLAREECRKKQWKYSWTRRGRVYVRRVDGEQAYLISSDKDISRVFGT